MKQIFTTICSELALTSFVKLSGKKVEKLVCAHTLEQCNGRDKFNCKLDSIHSIKTVYLG